MLEGRSQEGVSMVPEVNLEARTERARARRMWMLSLGFRRSREGRF